MRMFGYQMTSNNIRLFGWQVTSDNIRMFGRALKSLVTGRCGSNFKIVIFEDILHIKLLCSAREIALMWMPQTIFDDKSTLIQIMAWSRQPTSHNLSQCWPRSISPYGITKPQWVNTESCHDASFIVIGKAGWSLFPTSHYRVDSMLTLVEHLTYSMYVIIMGIDEKALSWFPQQHHDCIRQCDQHHYHWIVNIFVSHHKHRLKNILSGQHSYHCDQRYCHWKFIILALVLPSSPPPLCCVVTATILLTLNFDLVVWDTTLPYHISSHVQIRGPMAMGEALLFVQAYA